MNLENQRDKEEWIRGQMPYVNAHDMFGAMHVAYDEGFRQGYWEGVKIERERQEQKEEK